MNVWIFFSMPLSSSTLPLISVGILGEPPITSAISTRLPNKHVDGGPGCWIGFKSDGSDDPLEMTFNIIGVIGASRPDRKTYQLAEEVGTEIAHALNLGRTVVGLDTWKLERAYEKPIPGLVEAETPKEAVGMAMEAIL